MGAWLISMSTSPAGCARADDAEARKRVMDGIRQSDEWKQKHPSQ
jgi:hypothetical protein